MIELHGWLTISETCKDEDLLSQAEIEDINQKVNKIIANCDNDIELQYMNGIAFIRTLLCSNHHTKQVDDYKCIAVDGECNQLFINIQIESAEFSIAYDADEPDDYASYALIGKEQFYQTVKATVNEILK